MPSPDDADPSACPRERRRDDQRHLRARPARMPRLAQVERQVDALIDQVADLLPVVEVLRSCAYVGFVRVCMCGVSGGVPGPAVYGLDSPSSTDAQARPPRRRARVRGAVAGARPRPDLHACAPYRMRIPRRRPSRRRARARWTRRRRGSAHAPCSPSRLTMHRPRRASWRRSLRPAHPRLFRARAETRAALSRSARVRPARSAARRTP